AQLDLTPGAVPEPAARFCRCEHRMDIRRHGRIPAPHHGRRQELGGRKGIRRRAIRQRIELCRLEGLLRPDLAICGRRKLRLLDDVEDHGRRADVGGDDLRANPGPVLLMLASVQWRCPLVPLLTAMLTISAAACGGSPGPGTTPTQNSWQVILAVNTAAVSF